MKAFLASCKRVASSEPVRVYVYSVFAVVDGFLVYRGIVKESAVPYLEAIAATVLGLSAGETARAKVTPTSKLPE